MPAPTRDPPDSSRDIRERARRIQLTGLRACFGPKLFAARAPVIYSTARARSASYSRSGYRGVGRAIVQRRGACSVGRNPRGTPDSRYSIKHSAGLGGLCPASHCVPQTNPAWLPRKRVCGMARDPNVAALDVARSVVVGAWESRLYQPTESPTLRNVCAGSIAVPRLLTWEVNRLPGRVAGAEPVPSAPPTLSSPRISVRRGGCDGPHPFR